MSSAEAQQSFGWFCIHTQPKHEHIAAAALRQNLEIEVLLPRIRFQRATRNGPIWFTEALFLNYLFARFDLKESLRLVQHSRGVRSVVHFGNGWPTISDSVIAELRSAIGPEELRIINNDFATGETVDIKGGAFDGLQAIVTRVLPSRDRIAVLLDFLGRQTTVELSRAQLASIKEPRLLDR